MTSSRRNSQLPITAAPDVRAAAMVRSGSTRPQDDELGDPSAVDDYSVGDPMTDDPPIDHTSVNDQVATQDDPSQVGADPGRKPVPTTGTPQWVSGTKGDTVPVTHGGRTYKVKQGDTLYGVASKHGVSVPALAELNRISPRQNLFQGQVLSLPEKNELPDEDPSHVVQPGETLQSIAARHHLSPGQLRQANSMEDSSIIAAGELLLLRRSNTPRRRPQPELPAVLPRVAASTQTKDLDPRVLHAARMNKYTLLGRKHPAPAQARLIVATIAEELGAEPALIQAVAGQESGFQHTMVSPTNAIGIMQVTPRSGRWASDIAGRELDLLNIADNIVAGAVILGWLIETADSEDEALAGYYQDLRSVREHGLLPETKAFVRAVQLQRERLRGPQ